MNDQAGWRIDTKDPQRAYIRLTEFHELCANLTDDGLILDVVDSRFTARGENDVVHTQCLDYEDLNCCMEDV